MIRNVCLRVLACLLGLTSVACPAAAASFGEEALAGVCITEVTGEMRLDGRLLRAGDVLTAEQAQRIAVEEDASVSVSYLPVFADHVAAETTLALGKRENKAPVAEDQALETYRNLPNSAKLKVSDPEGEALTYTLVRQPRRGTLELGEDGSFTYTPKKNKVGIDSFTYTAADPDGKVSREATVTVTILKPSDAAQYRDTLGQDCRFAAEWMRHTGIFTAEQVAQEPCFGPEKTVTKGEFLTMLVKTLELPAEEEVSAEIGEDTPDWLKPYLTAAVRAGLTAGLPAFAPEEVITGEEAAAMLAIALDSDEFSCLTPEPMNRAQAAMVLYTAAQLEQAGKIDRLI